MMQKDTSKPVTKQINIESKPKRNELRIPKSVERNGRINHKRCDKTLDWRNYFWNATTSKTVYVHIVRVPTP